MTACEGLSKESVQRPLGGESADVRVCVGGSREGRGC